MVSSLALNTIVKIGTGESPNHTMETLEKITRPLDLSVGDL
jgi:DNA-binding Xre family transcriptional regulator